MYKRHEREKYKMADYVIYFIHISQAKLFFLARSCRKWKFREIYAFKSKFMVSMYVAWRWVGERYPPHSALFVGEGDRRAIKLNRKINDFKSFELGGNLWNFKSRDVLN